MNIKLTVNSKHAERGFADIQKANEVAAKNTLNTIAALTRKNSIERIKADFILRNNFTEKSIAYDRVKSKAALNDMQSITGALQHADYMRLQHTGGIRRPKRGSKVAIPQDFSRGGSKKRLVTKSFYLTVIKPNTVRGKFKKKFTSKKARTVAMAYVANKRNKFLKYNENIYKVTSFSKGKKGISFRKKHLYNVSERTTKVKRNTWLWDSAKKPAADAQNIYNSQFKKMLRSKKII